jgi:hypothetical protein
MCKSRFSCMDEPQVGRGDVFRQPSLQSGQDGVADLGPVLRAPCVHSDAQRTL